MGITITTITRIGVNKRSNDANNCITDHLGVMLSSFWKI